MNRRGLVLVAVATFIQLTPSAEAANLKLSIAAPVTVVGDGRSTVDVVVSISPASGVNEVSALHLTASAGTLLDPQPRGESALVYKFRAPRVATSVPVTFVATAQNRRRKIRARATVSVTAYVTPIGVQNGNGGLALQGPDHLVLGEHQRGEISLAAETEPQLVTNSGSISPPTRGDDGRWRATYTPGTSLAPRSAIVAAVHGPKLDWIAIPLHGRGLLSVTSERGANIELDVGGRRFGPIRADRRGETSIAITVPPGLSTAISIASDELGNKSRGTLPLDPPPFNRLLALCPDRTGPVRALVIDAQGKPAVAAAIRSTTNIGELDTFQATSAGVFAAPLVITTTPTVARIAIDLQLATKPTSRSSCAGDIPRAAPIAVVVEELSPKVHQAGGAPTELTIRTAYPKGSLPLRWPLSVTGDAGEVGEVEEIEPGRYRAMWTPPQKTDGKQIATIVAALIGSEVAPTETKLRLEPGPAKLLIPTAPAVVRADGQATGVAEVMVTDRFGNPTTVEGLSLDVGGSRFGLAEVGGGRYRGTFVVPRSMTDGTMNARVRAGELSSAVSLRFRGARPVLAASLRGGYITNFNRIAGATGSVVLEYTLPFASDRFTIGADLGLSLSNRNEAGPDPLEVGVRTITSQARVAAWFPIGRAWIYAGGSAGLANSRVEIESPLSGRSVSWESALAFGGFAGGELAVGFGKLIVEVAFQHAGLAGNTAEGNVLGLMATAGFRFGLF